MTVSAESIGYIAAILSTISFVPQVWLVWRTNDTRAISLGMYTLFVLGTAAWLIYGVIIGSTPIMISSIITVSLAVTILIKKIRHSLNNAREETQPV